MAQEARRRGKVTLVLFALLVIAEFVIATRISGKESDPLSSSLKYFLIVAIPLLFVFASIYIGTNLIFPTFLGWICIVAGIFAHYGYYISHDPSREMVLGVSLVAYWLCGVLALLSVSLQAPN
jgi:ABC-type uncharacterized transport system permease subunit